MILPTPLLAHHRGREVHGLSLGQGEPTTVLLTGLGVPAAWWHDPAADAEDVAGLLHSPPWAGRPCLAPLLAASGRVLTYDRAGRGESGPSAEVRDLDDFVAELAAVLAAAGVTRPVRLAGHSLGGVIALAYARRHPERVAGLVLLDSSHPDQLARFAAGSSPEELKAGAEDRREMARHHPERPDLASLLGQGPLHPGELGELPLLVVSRAATPSPRDRTWARLQGELAALSSVSRHLTLPETGHYVHLDAPLQVARTILTPFWTGVPVLQPEHPGM